MKTSTNKLILFLYVTLAALTFSNCSNKPNLDKMIADSIKEMNKQCPKAYDFNMRLDSLSSPQKGILAYNYTIIDASKTSLPIDEKSNQLLEKELTNSTKSSALLAPFRELRASFRYVYFDRNGELLYTFDITPEMYLK